MKKKLWPALVADILVAGVLLLIFAFFHHVLPRMKTRAAIARRAEETALLQQDDSTALVSEETPGETVDAQPEKTGIPEETITEEFSETQTVETETEETEPEVQDTRTEWQIQFAEHFTDEVVVTENSYSSPDVSITITTYDNAEEAEANRWVNHNVYYVADIYISSIECFRSWLANDTFEVYSTQDVLEMSQASNAILAMTGDFYSYQFQGIAVRNGAVYREDDTTSDICVLYKDGSMATYGPNDYNKEELLSSGEVWQLWKFGPKLLQEDGTVATAFNISETVTYINPRSGIGFYEPGHYCFVVVDGRQDGWSVGMRLEEFAQVFADLGCTCAYNLDGGGSAALVYENEIYSHRSNGGDRDLGDIVLITEPSLAVEITAEGVIEK